MNPRVYEGLQICAYILEMCALAVAGGFIFRCRHIRCVHVCVRLSPLPPRSQCCWRLAGPDHPAHLGPELSSAYPALHDHSMRFVRVAPPILIHEMHTRPAWWACSAGAHSLEWWLGWVLQHQS